MTTPLHESERRRWWQRKPKRRPPDYAACMREATKIKREIDRLVEVGHAAHARNDVSRLERLKDEMEPLVGRLEEIEREVTAR